MLNKMIFLYLFAVFFSYGEKVFNVDLEKALKMAVKASEEYQMQGNEVLKSHAQYFEVMSKLLPQVKGDITWLKNLEYPQDLPTAAFTKNYNIDYGLSANQLIYAFGRVYSALKGTKKMELAAYERKRAVESEIDYATKMIYYHVCLAENILAVQRSSYESTKKNKDLLLKRIYEGRISKRDQIKADADIAARQISVVNAQTEYEQALDSLKRHIGLFFTETIRLSQSYPKAYPKIEKTEAFSLLYKNHPLLKALKWVVQGQEYFVKSKKSEYFPIASMFFKYNYKGNSDDNYFVGNQFLRDYSVWGLNINIPLFDGFSKYQNVKKAKYDQKNASLNFSKVKKQLELELEKALSEYHSLLRTLPESRKAAALAEQTFIMSQDLLESGQMSLTDLNDAEIMWTGQKLRWETTLFKLNLALAKIEKLTGKSYEKAD